ncbi:hypothetical protein [Aeromicrobium sp. NPDC092404]|uniref:hypothetical protein n=1 Tax=Aeromicrobium sp. NPDC092404 TaxID=3154976 RepID=UPI0034145FCD
MAKAPGSTASTVTVFGDNNAIDHALGTQLERLGCRTHFVSVPTGWLRSAAHAVVRLDTAAGADALRELAETTQPRSHVVAVCPELMDGAESERVRDLCRACGAHHEVSLIWHPPLEANLAHPAGAATDVRAAAKALAASVADEMVDHSAVGDPSFVTRPFVPTLVTDH